MRVSGLATTLAAELHGTFSQANQPQGKSPGSPAFHSIVGAFAGSHLSIYNDRFPTFNTEVLESTEFYGCVGCQSLSNQSPFCSLGNV